MFGTKEYETEDGDQQVALLQQGCSFDGKLTFEGTVRIDGHFSGEIFSEGTLIVGEAASIEARLDVGSLVVHGQVIGEVIAKDRIELRQSARVQGNISAKTLVVAEGSSFDGQCRMDTSLGLASTNTEIGSHQEPERLAEGSHSF